MTRFFLSGFALALFGGAALASPAHVDHNFPAPQPSYPASSQAAGEQGDVTLGIYVSASGRARKFKLIKSSGSHDLDMAAAEGVINWHYVPAMNDGDAASSWMELTIHYELPKPADGVQPTAAKAQVN
jgi:TonB family protein